MSSDGNVSGGERTSFWNSPKVRSVFVQVLLFVLVVLAVFYFYINTTTNLAKLNAVFGYSFLNQSAGFDMIQKPIAYTSSSSFRRALEVSVVNTLLVASLGIVFATIIGFIVGIMRLSNNWLISRIAMIYVELVRNVPLLLQMLVWYGLVLKNLPGPREALQVLGVFLSNRGLVFPAPVFGAGAKLAWVGLGVAFLLTFAVVRWAKRRQAATGQHFPAILTGILLIITLPLLCLLAMGWPISWNMPVLGGFNFSGGVTIIPEFAALLTALSIYTGAFIAEIVRAGIQAVSRGQTEAAYALGVSPPLTTRLVVVPQAMRVIIPPLTSQYLNLVKNSSLAVLIGYPDLVAIGGTVINQTGKAIEVVLIWMMFYLTISLLTSAFMNWFNSRVRLVER